MVEELNDEVLFETKFVWEDALMCLPKEVREKYNQLPEDVQKQIFNNVVHSLGKGLEAGIMAEWEVVMNTAINNVDLEKEIHNIYEEQVDY